MTDTEYIDLVPKAPPEDLFEDIEEQDEDWKRGLLTFKAIGYEEADGWKCHDGFRGDLRREKSYRPALLHCSKCGGYGLAEWNREYMDKAIHIEDEWANPSGDYLEGTTMACPMCEEAVKLVSAKQIGKRYTRQKIATVATVERGYPVFTKYLMERVNSFDREREWAEPMEAYLYDGEKWKRLTAGQHVLGRWCWTGWKVLKRADDKLGCPWMYRPLPSYEGTALENAKLREYFEQSYKRDCFYPLMYLRLYQKRPQVENLIMCGLGAMVGKAIEDEVGNNSYTSIRPRLKWINWKEKKPAKMLGLTKEQLRLAKAAGLPAKWYMAYSQSKDKVRFETLLLAWKEGYTLYDIQRLAESENTCGRIEPILRYLKKQKETVYIYIDYLRLAGLAGENLEEREIQYPPNLRQAHDRNEIAKKYSEVEKYREVFEKMSERCRGLEWEKDGICIRVANTPQELVEEGKTLRHCVGGYSESHCKGRIILFIRHTRRPERSWFTLNVDVVEKKIIQNHGYRNERGKNGQVIQIPKRVKDFVEEWDRTIFQNWQLPKPKKAGRKKAA